MELEALARCNVRILDNAVYQINTSVDARHLTNRLAYWEYIEQNGKCFFTQQARYENCACSPKNKVDTPPSSIKLSNRRNLRYGVHGLHEYRGKFFPQLVRSLINSEKLESGTNILDPMCGSGTTLVEAEILGCNAFGVDMNPLSVLMSRAKTLIAKSTPEDYLHQYSVLRERLQNINIQDDWLSSLPEKDQIYIKNWFAPDVYKQLGPIIRIINTTVDEAYSLLFKVVLSNIIRRISYQKESDLRVRMEKNSIAWDVRQEFLKELQRSHDVLLGFLQEPKNIKSFAVVRRGDCRVLSSIVPNLIGKTDSIITSPPYATALPYLDTDRLSLYCLSLMSRSAHRSNDYLMIGNREITDSLRKAYWQEYIKNKNILPGDICKIIDRVDEAIHTQTVGFRRQNLPALLAKYFFDMRAVLKEVTVMLHENASAFVVVGNNHTTVGNDKIEINTHDLLYQLGESVGLTCEQMIDMEMLISRDIFKDNSGTSEKIICFRKL